MHVWTTECSFYSPFLLPSLPPYLIFSLSSFSTSALASDVLAMTLFNPGICCFRRCVPEEGGRVTARRNERKRGRRKEENEKHQERESKRGGRGGGRTEEDTRISPPSITTARIALFQSFFFPLLPFLFPLPPYQ